MQTVRMIKTFDGVLHESHEAAQKHLEKMHADVLSNIAIAITALDHKYVAIGNWVDENLGRFLHLDTIKQDMKLVKEEEED